MTMKTETRLLSLAMAITGAAAPLHSGLTQSTYFSEGAKSIEKIGAFGTGYYIAVAEPLGQNCQHGNIFISADRKGIYATLLATKLAGKILCRLDYSQPSGNGTICNIESVEVKD